MRTGRSFSAVALRRRRHAGERESEIRGGLLEHGARRRLRARRTSRRCRLGAPPTARSPRPVHVLARFQQPVDGHERVVLMVADQIAGRPARRRSRVPADATPRTRARTVRRSRRARDRTSRPSETRASSRRCRTAASAVPRIRECRRDDPAARTCRARAAGTPAPSSRRTSRRDTCRAFTVNAAVARCTVMPVLSSASTNFVAVRKSG